MATLFVRHTVSDSRLGPKPTTPLTIQKAKAVKAEAVYQAADNPTDVTVTHEFASVKEAQAFVASEELKKAMQSAGVVALQQFGSPTEPECRQVRRC